MTSQNISNHNQLKISTLYDNKNLSHRDDRYDHGLKMAKTLVHIIYWTHITISPVHSEYIHTLGRDNQ